MANPPLSVNATDNQAKSYLTSVFGTFKYQNKIDTPYQGMTATQVYAYLRKQEPSASPYNTAVAAYNIMLSAAIAKGIGTGVNETGQITGDTQTGIDKTNYNVVPGLSGIAEVGAVIDATYRQLTKASMWRSLGWILLGGTALGLGVWWYAKTEGSQGVRSVASGKLPHLTAPVLPLSLMGAGAYLLWFGVSYWEDTAVTWPSDPLKSLLQGKGLPTHTADASAASLLSTGESSQVQVSSGSGSGSATVPSSASQKQFIQSLLSGIHAPDTPANEASLVNWMRQEEPQSDWSHWNNPLNTTQSMPGAVSQNGVGVKSYTSLSQGLQATIDTLNNGNYADILLKLRSGQGLKTGASRGLSTWSGGGYTSA